MMSLAIGFSCLLILSIEHLARLLAESPVGYEEGSVFYLAE
ncbi:MAG: hypothetical protein ACREFG_05495 [Chthoniobacterales bacterium]